MIQLSLAAPSAGRSPRPRRILSLCDFSGRMVEPWIAAGYEADILDLDHPRGERREGALTRIGADILSWVPSREYHAVFAFPPCTHLALSGARWWARKGPQALEEGLSLVRAARRIIEASGAPIWALENPIGRLAKHWRKADHYFDPCDFAGYLEGELAGEEAYTKRTCLWTSPRFVMPEARRIAPQLGSKLHWIGECKARARLRSLTPRGFALAVYLANKER